jgi:non-heme chloroperoxidase
VGAPTESDRKRTMTQQTSRPQFASAQLATGVRLRYAEQGDPNGPALILLHGFTDSWFSWSAVLSQLSPGFHVFALDQRGHGDSERPESGYDVSDLAADVIAFMDAVGVLKATIVGHSMGSWVAQRTASLAPHRVERLVLLGTSATPFINSAEEFVAAIQELQEPVPVEFIREFQESTAAQHVSPQFIDRVVAESQKLPARVWRALSARWLQEGRFSAPERVTMPVLIIWGDQDAYFPRAEQDLLVTTLPNAALTVYEGTGHSLQWEQPERVVRDIEAFVRSTSPAPAK